MFSHRMNKKFGEIYKEAKKPENQIPLDLKRDLFVLFSDHHKGNGSPADDFKKNAILYDFALSYYKKNGYKLIVLGDNEELWENHYVSILVNYKALIEKEIEMALDSPDNKKIRLWGNHDKEVSLRKFRSSKHTQYKKILKNVEYREGLCLGENIFLIHGHQGRFFDDIAWKISRWAVQFIWKTIQKIFNIGIDGPAENFKIRDNLEMEYYEWAKKNNIILICGHTHRAVFASSTHIDSLQSEIQQLKGLLDHISSDKKENIEKEIISSQRQIEKILMPRSGKTPKPFEEKPIRPVPCYFNDGCCGYTNGITCIEIEKGIIRLIKWQRQEKRRIIFGERNLQLLLEYIKKGLPLDEPLKPA